MRVKNVCNKIINFGMKTLLPGEVCELPEGFENNGVVEALVENDNIVILFETASAPADVVEAVAEGAADLSKKKKPELLEICAKLGLAGNQENTKAELCEMIINATK